MILHESIAPLEVSRKNKKQQAGKSAVQHQGGVSQGVIHAPEPVLPRHIPCTNTLLAETRLISGERGFPAMPDMPSPVDFDRLTFDRFISQGDEVKETVKLTKKALKVKNHHWENHETVSSVLRSAGRFRKGR